MAKLAGIEMCDAYNRQHGTDFVAAIPTNTYGPHDHFDLNTSHVLPALLRKVQNDLFDYGADLATPPAIAGARVLLNRYGRDRCRSSSMISRRPLV